jgi:two-component system, LytTR family, sensor kinase
VNRGGYRCVYINQPLCSWPDSTEMQLQMKNSCGKCGAPLAVDSHAFICSYECTFCSACASESRSTCPNCAGELVRRPRRSPLIPEAQQSSNEQVWGNRPGLIWVLSFSIWTMVAVAASGSVYELWRSMGRPMAFATILLSEFCQVLPYAPLTPLVFALAMRFPLQRDNWVRRSLLHLSFAVVFCIAHITLRGLTPYAAWESGHYVSAVWNSHTHAFEINWKIFKAMFLSNIVDDITGAYFPIVLIAHALSYYHRFRDRELHAAKLGMQLAESHLQVLKSHLQPHFLFNTMHSISALMLTDVGAADKMMARLSDLLRMSLETTGTQITSLRQELAFVAAYLEIEKVRFGDRLNIVLDITPETLSAQVPSLLLQPLVENAIRHGISRLSTGGRVWITANRNGDHLYLRVRDNGPGLVETNDASPGLGLGLSTTKERLKTLYGNDQSLDIHDVSDGGVEVCAKIPFRVEPESSTSEVNEVFFAGKQFSGVPAANRLR